MSVLSSFENIFKYLLNINKKCNDRYTFKLKEYLPTWIPGLIFKYENTMSAL
jgi:hypothetical protein